MKNILNEQMTQIKNSVRKEPKQARTEIVFLSHKASMSDSIESIYMTAKSDPDTDAYWIPIPYYDLKIDKSFTKMHYEGEEYYKSSIECTDWRDYDIEARRPDVIFTFTPYDHLGRMTSVHPDFQCRKLRDITGLLVNVPYFFSTGAEKAPFTKCSGIVYSHLVVLQSDEVKQAYIRDYIELEKKGFSRAVYGSPRDKFVVLGSPKYDTGNAGESIFKYVKTLHLINTGAENNEHSFTFPRRSRSKNEYSRKTEAVS